jgi:ABC-type bacteriocin/lantibiotic exporter with double-glycine peptidase domain
MLNKARDLWARIGHENRKIPLVRQLNATDCGAAALTMVFQFHGLSIPFADVRRALDIGRNGSTMENLLQTARVYGFRGRGVSAEVDDLAELPPATILHWEFKHYVVLEKTTGQTITILDPALGQRVVPMSKVRDSFTGVALILEPSAVFQQQTRKPNELWGFLRYALQRSGLLTRIILTSFVIQVFSIVMPLLTGLLIDRVVPRKDYHLLVILASGYLIFQAFNAFAGFIRSHLFLYLQTKLEASLTFRFLDHLAELPYSFFQNRTSGDLMMRLGSNSSIKEILTTIGLSSVMDGLMVCIYVVVLFMANARLSVLVTIVALARVLLIVTLRRKQADLLAQDIAISARSQTYQVEMLSGMETLKAMGLETKAIDNWSSLFVDSLNVSVKRGQLDARYGILHSLAGTLSTLVIMFYGTYMVLTDTFSLGTMMAYSALAAGFTGPLNNLIANGVQFQMLEMYIERINDVIKSPPERQFAGIPAGRLGGAISLSNVSFRYSKDDPFIFEQVSVDIKPGCRVAIVGKTGCGKSTLARIIAGLYPPTDGEVLMDRIDLQQLNLRSVRSQLGYVTQDIQLFGGSVRSNIALADATMELDRVVRAAKLACVHEDILAMPMGYDTVLADRGLSLSGGQRQRIAIARALACDPVILVLDEATSHLDVQTESAVNRNLAANRCTRIVIAHRLSTIRESDIIIVLDQGRVAAIGTHENLLKCAGLYAELVKESGY